MFQLFFKSKLESNFVIPTQTAGTKSRSLTTLDGIRKEIIGSIWVHTMIFTCNNWVNMGTYYDIYL